MAYMAEETSLQYTFNNRYLPASAYQEAHFQSLCLVFVVGLPVELLSSLHSQSFQHHYPGDLHADPQTSDSKL